MADPTSERLPSYGGQAVIEGVMMRGRRACAIAVRAPGSGIVVRTLPLGRFYRSRLAQLPFFRGLFLLWDALVLGMRALAFSADVQAGEEQKVSGAPMALTMVAALTVGVGVFFLLPAALGYLVERLWGWNAWWVNVLEGLVRLGLLIGYVWAIGLWVEVRRVYGYHSAEHKTINAFEAGAALTVERVAAFPREHPRCGTAFLLTLVVLSILLFSLLGPLPLASRLASRLLLLPLLAALAYEYIRITSSWARYAWAKPLVAANLALQRLTTREPDGAMIEVAIAAFQAMQAEEHGQAPP
ncbi:MAG: DUF1385 domain-containing protein [Chloroflexota bacterium]